MIWIVTDEGWTPVADRVAAELTRRGVESLTVSPDLCSGLVVVIDDGWIDVSLHDRELSLPDAVLYLRDPVPQPNPHVELAKEESEFVSHQWRIMVRGLLTALEITGTPVVNSVASILVDEKTAQLVRAARLGFATPRTFHGLSATRAERFASEVGGRCASKPFVPFARMNRDGKIQRLLTNAVSPTDLRRGLEGATVASPTIVQPLIEAPYEHRVMVVGDRVFSARTARVGANAIDVRRVPVSQAEVTAGDLPADVAQRCAALVRTSGLYIAALDVLECADGSFVFLDLNPSGHFLWVEQLTGAPICAALSELLVDLAEQTPGTCPPLKAVARLS